MVTYYLKALMNTDGSKQPEGGLNRENCLWNILSQCDNNI